MSTSTLLVLLLGLIQHLITMPRSCVKEKTQPIIISSYKPVLVPWISALETLFPFHCSTMDRNHERILTSALPFPPPDCFLQLHVQIPICVHTMGKITEQQTSHTHTHWILAIFVELNPTLQHLYYMEDIPYGNSSSV